MTLATPEQQDRFKTAVDDAFKLVEERRQGDYSHNSQYRFNSQFLANLGEKLDLLKDKFNRGENTEEEYDVFIGEAKEILNIVAQPSRFRAQSKKLHELTNNVLDIDSPNTQPPDTSCARLMFALEDECKVLSEAFFDTEDSTARKTIIQRLERMVNEAENPLAGQKKNSGLSLPPRGLDFHVISLTTKQKRELERRKEDNQQEAFSAQINLAKKSIEALPDSETKQKGSEYLKSLIDSFKAEKNFEKREIVLDAARKTNTYLVAQEAAIKNVEKKAEADTAKDALLKTTEQLKHVSLGNKVIGRMLVFVGAVALVAGLAVTPLNPLLGVGVAAGGVGAIALGLATLSKKQPLTHNKARLFASSLQKEPSQQSAIINVEKLDKNKKNSL